MLTERDKALARLMVMEPNLTVPEYAKRIGVSDGTVSRRRYKPEFQEYYKEFCKDYFAGLEALAIVKLEENIQKNNERAIEYCLSALGYKEAEKHEIDMTAKIEIDYGEDE